MWYADSVEAHSCVCRYNMKLMSNTAASYQMGAGRFEPWLFVNCYRVVCGMVCGGVIGLCDHRTGESSEATPTA